MERIMLKSKIHRATITGTDINYSGSITIDKGLLEAADMLPGEQVHVLNLSNGTRFTTYIIEAPHGSGTILLNGPAARLGEVDDQVIVLSYCHCSEDEAHKLRTRVVLVDSNNRIRSGKGNA